MTFSYKKEANTVVISIEDLKKLVPDYQVKIFDDHVEVEEETTIFDSKTFNNGEGVEIDEFVKALENSLK